MLKHVKAVNMCLFNYGGLHDLHGSAKSLVPPKFDFSNSKLLQGFCQLFLDACALYINRGRKII